MSRGNLRSVPTGFSLRITRDRVIELDADASVERRQAIKCTAWYQGPKQDARRQSRVTASQPPANQAARNG